METIMMVILLLSLIFITFYKSKFNYQNEWFVSKDYTNSLKGIMCLIVVLVHIPVNYGNKIQDLIGSFAFVCVTLFFMFSAYGLIYNLENKTNYIHEFPKKRFINLLIPYFICNFLYIIIYGVKPFSIKSIKMLLGFDSISFITVLIFLYLMFYIICLLFKIKKIRYIFLILLPILISFFTYLLRMDIWNVEMIGFSLGFILYITKDKVNEIFNDKKHKIAHFLFLLIICAVNGVLYLKTKNVFFLGEYIIRLLLDISMITLLLFVTNKIKIYNYLNSFLGKISYEIYLYHGIVIYLINKININQSYLFICIVLFVTIVISTVINKFDKLLIDNLLNKKRVEV